MGNASSQMNMSLVPAIYVSPIRKRQHITKINYLDCFKIEDYLSLHLIRVVGALGQQIKMRFDYLTTNQYINKTI